ncbi:MAG: hypothetical protein N3H31_04745 [Candidatus Nezhaarchaeota archaeon]|nr:hypothetical protein [Candidatus Nezhaarchaeota archaeon]
MGGTKKKSISQMEKQQKLREKREREKAERERKRREEKAERDRSAKILTASKQQVEAIAKEASSAGYITPFTVASRLNVKLSVAKMLLRDVEARGLIKLVAKSPRTLVYAPAS